MTAVLDWTHPVSEIGERGLDARRVATPAERSALAAALGIVACNHLAVTYRIEPRPQGAFMARGEIEAEVVQSCVVTLDPVAQRIQEPFQIEFRPKGAINTGTDGEQEALAPDDPEPIENNRLALGRVIYEIVASALDPYPRAADVVLEDSEGTAGPKDSKANPFAALAAWKPKSQ